MIYFLCVEYANLSDLVCWTHLYSILPVSLLLLIDIGIMPAEPVREEEKRVKHGS